MSGIFKSRGLIAAVLILVVVIYTFTQYSGVSTPAPPSAPPIDSKPVDAKPPLHNDPPRPGVAVHDAAAAKVTELEAKIKELQAELTTSHSSQKAEEKEQGFQKLQGSEEEYFYSPERDRDNHGLTHDQCMAAFPDLYREIDRSAVFWKKRLGGNITPEHISLHWSGDGGLRCMIYNQELYIVMSRGLNHFKHWVERSHGTLHQIHRALISSPEPVPNIEFSIKINDVIDMPREPSNITLWAFSRNISDPVMNQTWLIPDFNFWAYPRVAGSFDSFQQQAMEIGSNFTTKKDLLVWRGTIDFNPGIREPLLQQAQGKPWSDVHRVDEDSDEEQMAKMRISMPDHCRYKFAVHTEGTTWSGRLKYLLSCNSAIFVHKLSWYTHLYHLLEPSGEKQNVVEVDNEWKELPSKIEDLIEHPAKAKQIADNAAAKFRDRYFTPAAQTCYWRQLFRVWREASFEPEPFTYKDAANGPNGTKEKTIRGMSYEEYIFWDKDVPPS